MSTKKLNEALAILDSCLEHPNASPYDRATCRAAIAELESIERAAREVVGFVDMMDHGEAGWALLKSIAKESMHD